MKYLTAICFLVLFVIQGRSQNTPKIYDPCQKIDTNEIKKLIIGNWVDMKDSNHTMVITEDSIEEQIVIGSGVSKKTNMSYFNYKFTDNMFSSDEVTCYSLVEYLSGHPNHTDFAINSVTDKYLLLGATGKMAFKRRN